MVDKNNKLLAVGIMAFGTVLLHAGGALASSKIELKRSNMMKVQPVSHNVEAASNDVVDNSINAKSKKQIAKLKLNASTTNSQTSILKSNSSLLARKSLNNEIVVAKPQAISKTVTKTLTIAPIAKPVMVTEAQMLTELGQSDLLYKAKSNRPIDVAPWQKIGSPYQVNGIWYIPAHEPDYDEIGTASWYGKQFQGRPTANGEIFDMNEVTIAHPTLPIPCLVEVTNLENGRSVIARVNDRGPFADNRIIDMSQRGAELLGFKDKGTAKVRVKYVGYSEPANKLQPQQFALERLNPNSTPMHNLTKEPQKNVYVENTIYQKPAESLNSTKGSNNTQGRQIGAFVERKYADSFVSSHENKNDLRIVEAQTPNGKFFRVIEISADKDVMPSREKPRKNIDHNSILASL